MNQINSSDLSVGFLKLETNKQSQNDPQEANYFYAWFLPDQANGEIYWTLNIEVINKIKWNGSNIYLQTISKFCLQFWNFYPTISLLIFLIN